MQNRKLGFTLLEVALVLSFAGLIIGGVFILVSTAMHNSQMNRLQSQIISTVQNVRSYAHRVDVSTISLTTTNLNDLSLLPSDIANNGTYYVDAIGKQFDACAAGGTNATTCGATGQTSTVAVVFQNLSSADCGAILSSFSSSGASDLGFIKYMIGGASFPTSTASNLTLLTIGGASACGSGSSVTLELDFSL